MVQRPIDLLPGALAAMLLGAACHQIGSTTGQRVKHGVVGSADRPAQFGLAGTSPAVANHADGQLVGDQKQVSGVQGIPSLCFSQSDLLTNHWVGRPGYPRFSERDHRSRGRAAVHEGSSFF